MKSKKIKKPNWQTSFRNLPVIPESKRWLKGGKSTQEHIITQKLFKGQSITQEEKDILEKLRLFYLMLYHELDNFDYKALNKKDEIDFKNYILYAFNYIPYLLNKTEIFQVFRVTKNKANGTIVNKKLLTYPPLHLVKSINKYNRANTPITTVFYGSESIDTALNEIKPQVGDLITISKWKPLSKKCILNAFHISHTGKAYVKNAISTSALNFFELHKQSLPKELINFLEPYLYLLGREYEKEIHHHLEYIISALFSERILNKPLTSKHIDVECIIYPSVGNKYMTSNLAIRKEVFRHNFSLDKVIEVEVTETHYDQLEKNYTDQIKIISYKNYKETSSFEGNQIIW